ncbi:MAG: prepilin peptidase [Phycisphaerae bacterium]|nr:prepilin peptidase [Phycisphaerae bacterium]
MDPFWVVTCTILVPGILWASWIDYSQRRVPNWLNATLVVVGLVVQAYFHGFGGVTSGLLGMLVGFGVLIIPWTMHGMGAGDVKLMAAIGVWFGPWMTLVAFAVGGVLGGIIAMVMIVYSGRLQNACANLGVLMVKMQSRDTAFGEFGSAKSFAAGGSQLLPYGVPLTIGSLIVLGGQVFHWWVL